MGLSNVPDEAFRSVRNIGSAAKRGYERDAKAGLVGKPVNAVAEMGIQGVTEAVRLPLSTIVKPAGKFVLGNTLAVVKGTVGWTARALLSVPLIPFKNGSPR